MFEKTVAFERSRRSIVFGVCAFLPANMIVPILQKCFGGMSLTSFAVRVEERHI